MNVGKNYTAFIKHSLQKDAINEAEFEQYTTNAAKRITFVVHSMGGVETKGNPFEVVKVLAHYISIQIKDKLNRLRIIKSFQRFQRRQDPFWRKLSKEMPMDIILYTRAKYKDRREYWRSKYESALIDLQLLRGSDPERAQSKSWRNKKVNRLLTFEFGDADWSWVDDHYVTIWRNKYVILKKIYNAMKQFINYDPSEKEEFIELLEKLIRKPRNSWIPKNDRKLLNLLKTNSSRKPERFTTENVKKWKYLSQKDEIDQDVFNRESSLVEYLLGNYSRSTARRKLLESYDGDVPATDTDLWKIYTGEDFGDR